MTWLSPWLAGGVAAVAIPSLLILYFLKLRRRDLEISTTLLWKKAVQDLQANAPFQRLRRNILLLLQLLILAGVIAALGQPFLKGQSIEGDRHVILIDRSASMSSTDGSDKRDSRLDVAKREAIALVESLREPGVLGTGLGGTGDQAMVIAFDTNADVLQTFTSDKGQLRAAIESIRQTHAPTRIELAMQLAKANAPKRVYVDDRTNQVNTLEGVTAGPPVTMQLWTDGKIPDAEQSKPGVEDTLIYHQVGDASTENVGITSLKAERAFDDPDKLTVFVGVINTASAPRTVEAELLIDGVVAAIKSVELPSSTQQVEAAGEAALGEEATQKKVFQPGAGGFVFTMDRADGFLAQVRLRQSAIAASEAIDAFSVDDRAWIVVPPSKRLAVAVVSADPSDYLRVLERLPYSKLDTLTPAEFQGRIDQGKWSEYDVVLLDGFLPELTRPGMPSGGGLPPGRYLIFNAIPQAPASSAAPTPPTQPSLPNAPPEAPPIAPPQEASTSPQSDAGLLFRGETGSATMIDWQRTHPALRGLTLDKLFFSKSKLIEIPRGAAAEVLARSEHGPAIVELSAGQSRAIVVGMDYRDSLWPFNTSWVVFLAASVEYLGGDLAAIAGMNVQPGATLADRLPGNSTNIELRGPTDEQAALIPAPDGRIVYGPIKQTGIYRVSWTGQSGATDLNADGKVERRYAANLLDLAESDVAASEQLALANQVAVASGTGSGTSDRKLWPYLVLAALLIVMLEWWVYNRKVHV